MVCSYILLQLENHMTQQQSLDDFFKGNLKPRYGKRKLRVKPPVKIATPYGGRLVLSLLILMLDIIRLYMFFFVLGITWTNVDRPTFE